MVGIELDCPEQSWIIEIWVCLRLTDADSDIFPLNQDLNFGAPLMLLNACVALLPPVPGFDLGACFYFSLKLSILNEQIFINRRTIK
jgi:hypothetical protein